MKAIDKVLNIAAAEVGYLEKRSNSNLDSATANAGSNNYTKYWRDIKPSYQGEPWCACFVTWCFVKAFGKDMAKKLLKHYPYVYCPTMAELFTLHANPERGDIVIFKHGGEFTHTGIVTSVDGDYFTTIEGNTSGGSTIIANGGAVCKKGYYNSNLPGTKFVRPDYSIVEEEDIDMTKYEELKAMIDEANRENARQNDVINVVGQEIQYLIQQDEIAKRRYNSVADCPEWAREAIQYFVDRGDICGDENGNLDLTYDMVREKVFDYRKIQREAAERAKAAEAMVE